MCDEGKPSNLFKSQQAPTVPPENRTEADERSLGDPEQHKMTGNRSCGSV